MAASSPGIVRRGAETRIAANSRLAEVVRGFATRLFGVEYYFEPGELIALYERILRQLLRDERLAVAVRGPALIPQRASRRVQAESAHRFRTWHDGIEAVCERLHVTFLPYDPEIERPENGLRLPGDPGHYTLYGTRIHGRREGEIMVRAWRAAHASATS